MTACRHRTAQIFLHSSSTVLIGRGLAIVGDCTTGTDDMGGIDVFCSEAMDVMLIFNQKNWNFFFFGYTGDAAHNVLISLKEQHVIIRFFFELTNLISLYLFYSSLGCTQNESRRIDISSD